MKPVILAIDDEPEIILALKVGLAETFSVLSAHSIEQAKQVLIEHHPDAILLDLDLGDTKGEDTIKELTSFCNPAIPIIAFSGDPAELAKVRDKASQVMVKGNLKLKDIVATVHNVIVEEEVGKLFAPVIQCLQEAIAMTRESQRAVEEKQKQIISGTMKAVKEEPPKAGR